MRRLVAALLTTALLLSTGISHAADEKSPVVVFAAASLTDAVTEIATAFTKETGIRVQTSFAASSTLARQIEAGGPAEVFFPADQDWMDYLEKRGLLAPGSRRDVVGNKLVLIAPADSTANVRITTGPAFLAAIRDSRIATGDPDSVPVGKYAKTALTTLGVWDAVQPRIVRAENVRSALAFVSRGEAPFGIVYLTDARIDKNVKVLDAFPDNTHAPILYPIALTTKADADAQRFVNYVSGKSAAATFEKFGFSLAQ
ncbi:MAG: molybdate ABC transporter substrate-binding protein [Steroidobacteraceae bacterium]|nr:molybdate ABC transporter substrate-binding protein [Steroidobacteraceae bacterium]